MNLHGVILLLALLFASSLALAAADPKLSCQSKIDAIEQQGVAKGALLYAMKHVDPKAGKASRYILLAQMGQKRAGELIVVDTQTGSVTKFPMQAGLPENSSSAGKLRPEMRTSFGVMQVNSMLTPNEENMGLKTEAMTESLKTKTAARDGYPVLMQAIAHCPKFGKRQQSTQLYYANDFCLEREQFQELTQLLESDAKMGSGQPMLFAYPKDGVATFTAQNKAPFDGAGVCKILENIAAPGSLSNQPPAMNTGGTDGAVQ